MLIDDDHDDQLRSETPLLNQLRGRGDGLQWPPDHLAGLADRVLAQDRATQQPPSGLRTRWLRPLLSVAAAALLLMAAFFWWQSSSADSPLTATADKQLANDELLAYLETNIDELDLELLLELEAVTAVDDIGDEWSDQEIEELIDEWSLDELDSIY